MRRRLDTHVLIWSVVRPDRLGQEGMSLIGGGANEILFSAVSIWEVAIKTALRRPDFDLDPSHLSTTAKLDFKELHLTADAAARVASLPLHHRDSFDRVLAAPAVDADALLLTADATLSAYAPHVLMLAPAAAREQSR